MDTYTLAREIAQALVEHGACFEMEVVEDDPSVEEITQRGVDLIDTLIVKAVKEGRLA